MNRKWFSLLRKRVGMQFGYGRGTEVENNILACLAPWTSMNFTIDGQVSVCCLNKVTSVPLAGRTLLEIWNGHEFKQLRDHVSIGDLSFDCQVCKAQVDAGNMDGLKANDYRKFAPPHPQFPKVMEFCLDNTCNLGCTMCNSVLSSTIRKERGLPPHRRLYDDGFVEELEPFIPHLHEAVFSGGEPFLIPLYYRIWEKMLKINPQLTISVVTNGTVLNDKLKGLLERGRFRINVSIDSVSAQTYATIRRHSDLALVLTNFRWFCEYGERKNLRVNIPVCLLTLNWRELPDMVQFANSNGASINFVHVDRPFRLALLYQDRDYLAEVITQLEMTTFDVVFPVSEANVARFSGMLQELRAKRDAVHGQEYSAPSQNTKCDGTAETVAVDTSNRNIPEQLLPVLEHVPERDRQKLIVFLSKFSEERLLQFMEGRSVEEAATMLREFSE